jgi:hypothetical protein
MNTYFDAPSAQHDWFKVLQHLVRRLNRPDIRSVSSLMGKVIGDRNAATMFLRLLYWFPKSRKSSGWVYKSWRDWQAECNLSQAQVKRIHRMGYLDQVGIERKTMKANGTPTTHYRLNEQQLLRALSRFTGLSVEQIRLCLIGKPMLERGEDCQMKMVENDQPEQLKPPFETVHQSPIHPVKSTQSITSIPAYESTNIHQTERPQSSPVVVNEPDGQLANHLHLIGISALKATSLITLYGYERVAEVCEQVEKQRPVNPAGYLISALQEKWQWRQMRKADQILDGQAYITGPYADFIHS